MSSTRHRQRGDRTAAEFTGKVNPWVRVEREHVFREGTAKQPLGYQWVVSSDRHKELHQKKKVVHVAALTQSGNIESEVPPQNEPAKKTLKIGSIKLKLPLKK
jgi:hypothetical protein